MSRFLFLVAMFASSQLLAQAPRPNILYFYVDDMGWGAIAPNGQAERKAASKPHLRTPHLDRLAAEGVNFPRGYGATVCSPARSSQQSGFHQGHTFADRNDPDNAKKAMRADDRLMGDMLKDAGYVTGYWGKWGYGGSKDMANPTIDNIQTLPTSHGYTHVVAELHHVRAHTFFQPTLWRAPAKGKGGLDLIANSMAPYRDSAKYPNTPALQNHKTYPNVAYCDDVYCFAALDFVRDQAQNYNAKGQPFFGLLAVQVPHAPFDEVAELPNWDADYRDAPWFADLSQKSKQWAAMISRIDGHFGNILAALEDPNGDGDKSDSVAENTLVIFQSDNGGPAGAGHKEFDSNGGLRGNKGSIYDGGIRVPTLMRWPGKIAPGSSNNRVIDVTDLLPTFCELAGVPAPLGVDGVSLAPTLTGQGQQRQRDFLIHEAGKGKSVIRGDKKLVLGKKGAELYDLKEDHSESKSISGKNKKLVKELEAILVAEHATQPKGFATTYHSWTGSQGSDASKAANWSNYTYANADIIYMSEDGAPQTHWIARMGSANSAAVSADLAVLGLEITGQQQVRVSAGTTLTARNELRLSGSGSLQLAGGTLATMRWVDILDGASLKGHGRIVGNLSTRGTLDLDKSLEVTGSVLLGGKLVVSNPQPGPILTGASISGRFSNATVGGLDIVYGKRAVSLRVR